MTEQTLTEQLQERRDLMPDKWTLAWWDKRFDEKKQQVAGLQHTVNNLSASNRDLWAEQKAQRKINALQATEIKENQAVIGELTARLDRQGEFLTVLKEKGAT
mgnify:CR=1 FL=1